MRQPTTLIAAAFVALFATGTLAAEDDKPAPPKGSASAAAVESAVATGTVTATDEKRKSFTFKDDADSEELEYRAYFRSPEVKAILEQIKALKVGDRLKVTYTENEGRRAMKIEHVAAK